MNQEKMASFIVELRKGKNSTQKALAEQLGITDKAVSKWERGLSCPDISLLAALSEILGVTTGELLNGERANEPTPEIETVIEITLHYADAAAENKYKDLRKLGAGIFSCILFLGMVVCIICNLATAGALTWAWFPIVSILFVWAIVVPIFLLNHHRMLVSLAMLSILLAPFLFSLEKIIGIAGLIMPMGIQVSAIALLYLWGIYLLVAKTRLQRYVSAAASVMLGIPVQFGINLVVSKFTGEPIADVWDWLSYAIIAAVALTIFSIGYTRMGKILRTK